MSEISAPATVSANVRFVVRKTTARLISALAMSCLMGLSISVGCASTEYLNEGPGQPTDRASGAVPGGSIGVCKEPLTKKPPIVSAELWDHAKPCTSKTPASFIRLGYAKDGAAGQDPEAEQLVQRVLTAVDEGSKAEGGNAKVTAIIREVRKYAAQKDGLRNRVARESALEHACDFTYLLGTMAASRSKLEPDNRCPVEVFDQKVKKETCLFDVNQSAGMYLTNGWDCLTFTGAVGNEQSCYRLCGYDDYCVRQVYCASSDLDLLLCTMGVCLPEARGGYY